MDFDLAAAERELFEAQVALESGQIEQAGQRRYHVHVARRQGAGEARDPERRETIPSADRQRIPDRFYDTQKFFDPFAGGNLRTICFGAREVNEPYTPDSTRYLIDEAQLFIDAAHSCYNRLGMPASV